MANTTHAVSFQSESLALEGVLDLPPATAPVPGVALCHPHPLHGANMDNNVVVGVGNALLAVGIAVLRFNFRGVGGSQGDFAHGVGEVADAAAALAFLADHPGVDPQRIGIAGYSFGAGVALAAARQSRAPGAVALISCPRGHLESLASHDIQTPKLLVAGDRDHVIDAAAFDSLSRGLGEPKEVHLVGGVDHFWRGKEPVVGGLTAGFFGRFLLSPR